MRGLLRWIIVAILVVVVILLLVNVANKSKSKTKPKTKEPTVYERSTRNTTEDTQEGLVPVEENIDATGTQSIDMADTASFSTICVFIGTFVLSFGFYYINKKQVN